MISAACSTSRAVRSGIFVSAIWRTCARVRRPTLLRFGSPEPLSIRRASWMRTAAGGVFVMYVNERSSYTVISTGVMRPFWSAVWALNALQNSMMLTPCCPSAGPTGGAGLACPPGICSLIRVRTFFAIATSVDLLDHVEAELDRDLALEDVHEHLQLLLVGVDVDDLPVEIGERAGGHLHRLAERELDLRASALTRGGARMQDAIDLGERERDGLRACADEPGHAWRVLHECPRFVVERHVYEN